jgi:hypothetical protein
MTLEEQAYRLLKDEPDYIADAEQFAQIGNSVVGSVLSLTTGSPRWATEQAVLTALERLRTKKATT